MRKLLLATCLFTGAAGAWLGIMENILKHDGYHARTAVAACITLQGLATLLVLLLSDRIVLRYIVIAGAVLITLVGASAVQRVLRASHFEGFVLVIGLGLIMQGVLTFGTLLRARRRPAIT